VLRGEGDLAALQVAAQRGPSAVDVRRLRERPQGQDALGDEVDGREPDRGVGLSTEVGEGCPLGLGLGFEIGAHLTDHGRPVALGLHHDQPPNALLDPLQPRRALPKLGRHVAREGAEALGQAVADVVGGIGGRDR
jgi:hypothetical protein